MAYAAASDVAALTPDLLAGSANFSAATSPTLAEVQAWLSAGCAVIEGVILGRGFQPPGSGAGFEMLRQLNALYAAAMAEYSRTTPTLSIGERTRGQLMYELYQRELKSLQQMDLGALGLGKLASMQFTGATSRYEW